ncbi:hypothetical protein OROMI_019584 [Orobanche minor]
MRFTTDNQEMSAGVIKNAYLATEEEFLSVVKKQWETRPQIASVGSCCLVGVVCNGLLYVENAGDSRVVLGRVEKGDKEIKAVQLSDERNARFASVREELHSLHPDDPEIVVLKHKVWRVKGIIQADDKFMKLLNFLREQLHHDALVFAFSPNAAELVIDLYKAAYKVGDLRAFGELRKLEIFFKEETTRGCAIVELYELVQHAGNILPRLERPAFALVVALLPDFVGKSSGMSWIGVNRIDTTCVSTANTTRHGASTGNSIS